MCIYIVKQGKYRNIELSKWSTYWPIVEEKCWDKAFLDLNGWWMLSPTFYFYLFLFFILSFYCKHKTTPSLSLLVCEISLFFPKNP